METKYFLIISKTTSQMLIINKTLKASNILTELVPAPPESGTVCAIAIKINESDLNTSKDILNSQNIEYDRVLEEKKLKLQGLIDKKTQNYATLEFIKILEKIEEGKDLIKSDIVYLLSTTIKKEVDMLFNIADKIRQATVGDIVDIRGAIEFSNHCKRKCKYCGINALNSVVKRYRMSKQEIMEVVYSLKEMGLKTVILQSGEDQYWSMEKLEDLIKTIKQDTGMKITLSIGEKTKEEYEKLKEVGADNFLLKIETTNKELFQKIHPDTDYDYRIQCSEWLKELGYINGSGNIIGIPGQTVEDIAEDVLYFKNAGINMIGIGPFIPAKDTELENVPTGDIQLTLRTVAVTRIVCKKVFIPSTTALASLDIDAQVMALKAGANTIMLINTPEKYRSSYKIYDNKNPVDIESAIYAIQKAGRNFPKYLKLTEEVLNEN